MCSSDLKHFATFLIGIYLILFDFLKWKFKPLPDLLNAEIAIIEIGLFYDGENLESKICRFQAFLASVFIVKDDDV